MKLKQIEYQVHIPTVDEFAAQYRRDGTFAREDARFLFDLIMSPESYLRARIATLDLDLPAVAGVAKICFDAVENNGTVEWNGRLKQFIGSAVCCLMEANGFSKTGTKRAIPHAGFTKGEMYRPTTGSLTA